MTRAGASASVSEREPCDPFEAMVGRSVAMDKLKELLRRVARTEATVLLEGESGVGKEEAARALHLASPRASHPMVVLDGNALPPTLIESELFGHERGSFTGAVSRVAGAFERAHGSTLFIDEIGELPLDLQPKLLRALESRVVRRIGSSGSTQVDIRVVAATNRDMAAEVRAGRFRKDLYYRLCMVKITVPPLRERLDDVPLIAERILAEQGGCPQEYLTPSAVHALTTHDWPGNVRELRNCVVRALMLGEPICVDRAQGEQEPVASGAHRFGDVDVNAPLAEARRQVVEEFERHYLGAQLEACAYNVSEVARRSRMDRMSIHRMMNRLGISLRRTRGSE
jgi:DNA-binding NtrC family response regulator